MAESHPNSAFVPFDQDGVEHSITQRFEWIVDRYPDSLAVKDSRGDLTYSALNQSANRLAHVLLDEREGVGESVGLLLGKDAVAIAAVMGVLKAGKAYVPLDPSYPFDRLKSISEHAQLTSLLTDANNAQLADKLSSSHVDVIRVDHLSITRSAANPGLQLSADTLAAIFYTSGSTAKPKGVMQSHRNILHRAMIDTNRFHICSHDRLSLLTSPSYSVSLRNLFGALLNGAAVCSFDIEKEGLNALANWLSRDKITIYFSIPTVFRQLAGNLTQSDDLSRVRLVDLGGEPVRKCDVEIYQQYFPANCIFVNSLASNEAGLYRTYFIDKGTSISDDVVPAGYEVRDKEICLLDEHGNNVESDQVGEIVIRSRYLSPGYWRNPELTAKVFKQDTQDPLKRIYHTGDLGLRRPDGCLSYIGRKDFRTKIRGIRVELEEVESAIVRHPSVQEAVVIDRRDGESEDSRLITYLVVKPERNLGSTELRAFLKGELPDYMLPSSYVFLEALPLTPNGKVDRKAILHNYPVVALKQPYVAPRNSVESQLATIWETIFKLQPIGIHDNFLDLGGDSLLAMQVVSKVTKLFQLELQLQSLFQSPTVAEIAALIIAQQEKLLRDKALMQTLREVEAMTEEAQRHVTELKSTIPIK